jgi:hypothetical protein
MDIIFGVIGFILGFGIAKSNSTPVESSVLEVELQEKNKQLIEDVAYYKKLTKTLVEENKTLRASK